MWRITRRTNAAHQMAEHSHGATDGIDTPESRRSRCYERGRVLDLFAGAGSHGVGNRLRLSLLVQARLRREVRCGRRWRAVLAHQVFVTRSRRPDQ